MLYKRIDPPSSLYSLIECYWIIEDNEQTTPSSQKIIPDGFTEIIFHYGDPYRITLMGECKIQANKLLAGQIDRHFHIENTGKSAMIGIKFKPAALSHLFGLDMAKFTNKVSDIADIAVLKPLIELLDKSTHSDMVDRINQFFIQLIKNNPIEPNIIDRAIEIIFENNGMISIQKMSEQLDTSPRQLERYFNKFIGLSPKLYMRIIRFNYIFELMKNKDHNWQDLIFQSGYYDQSHFIKNFQEFTGEDPTQYGFDEKNMANFFLKKLEN